MERLLEIGMRTTLGRALRAGLAMALAATVLLGCGGSSEDPTKARLRLVNASAGYDSLALDLGDTTVVTGVPYGGSASFADVDPKATDASVSAPSSAAVLASITVSLAKKKFYSVLAYGKAGALAAQLLDENTASPDSGKALIRIINAAPDAGTLDVYLTGSGDSLSASTALQSALAYGQLGAYTTIVSGAWRLRVAAAGSKTDVRLDLPALNVASQGVVTLVLTPGRGGVLVNSLLLSQQGDIANAANAQARVRAVAGVSGGASVSADVAGTSLMNGVGAPALVTYSLVDAGSVPVAASANGNATSLTSATLAGGGDYTLMVYGSPDAPVAVLIEDDNSLPSDTSGAKLRLAHGVADDAGTLTLKVDFLVTADGVAQGTASPYDSVAASTTAHLTVTTPGVAGTIFDQSNYTIAADSVYTFFVVDATSSAQGILAKDR
jgi:hypothetical protein